MALFKKSPKRDGSDDKNDLVGYLDAYENGRLQGWAASRGDGDRIIEIHVFVFGKKIAHESATLAREDLEKIGFANTRHGFDIEVDLPLMYDKNDFAVLMVDINADRSAQIGLTPKSRRQIADLLLELDERAASISDIQGMVLFDIQDLLNFLTAHNNVTGIQRVVGGLIISLLRSKREKDFRFCILSMRHAAVRIVNSDDLLLIVDLAMAGNANQIRLCELVDSLKDHAYSYVPNSGNTYFITGAYWIVVDFGNRLNRLKETGVVVGAYIYDLIPITAAQWVTDETRLMVTIRAIEVFLLADFFLTISEFVAAEVREIVKLELSHVKPTYPVLLPHKLPVTDRKNEAVKRTNIGNIGRFILCVCTLEGRKNHILLFRIWAAMIRKLGFMNVPQLVLVGRWGWNIATFQSAIEDSDFLDGKITILSDVGNAELGELYENCDFTVFPSFVEGWGLPVGESLSLGRFCIASNRSSIPEVGGDFVSYIDPDDFFQSYETIAKFITDPSLLREKTKRIEDTFVATTWDQYAVTMMTRIAEARSECEPQGRLIPHLNINRNYSIDYKTLVKSETSSWEEKALKFLLVSGWQDLEDDGVRSTGERSVLRLKCDELKASSMTLMLELRLAEDIRRAGDVLISSEENEGTHASITRSAIWVRHTIHRSLSGLARVEISGSKGRDHDRGLVFALSRVMLFPEDGLPHELPLAAMRALGIVADRPGRDLNVKLLT